jgi:predicted negative regulator of RcsB-dependent stress response
MSTTPATSRQISDDDPIQSFIDWAQRYSRAITVIALALVVGLGGWMFYGRSKAMKIRRAEEALARAAQSLGSGNIPLAQSDMEKLIVRYKGTPSAAQAAMLLAQTYYEAGKPQEGIDRLTKVQKDVGKTFQPSIESLLGDGYDLLGKPLEAAKHYREAAAKTPFPTDRANYLASAARSLTIGGQKAEAAKIWTDLAQDPENPVAGEARVRLGELTAAPASGS